MNFLSVCSGIEAASVAWQPLGWKAWALAQFDPLHDYTRGPDFPSAVLAHHYPNTPNLGDMSNFKDWPDGSIDLLCGGTPCQSFSNAGLRAGLDDPRGQLMLTFGAIAARYRPKWLVWENVPGVLSSNGGRDFGSFLGLLGHLGYGFAYRILDAQYVRVDGYGRAVPQRRNRVFVVGCLGDWRRAAAVLLERESLLGDSAPRRSAGARTADMPARSIAIRGRGGYAGRRQEDDVNIVAGALGGTGPGAGWRLGADEAAANHCVAATITAQIGEQIGQDARNGNLIAFDTTQITSASNYSNPKAGDTCHPLAAGAHAPAVAFGWQNAAAQGMPVDNIAPTLDKSKHPATSNGAAVRRLTPTECERLMGFPDGYTLIPLRNRKGLPNGKWAKDGPRYKALGNSWAVNCARWIGRRISLVEGIR